ncbi:MAG: hypothetical protein KF816_09830 [Melioribacteraceae bacterium]|nr:hypothetical protein [Melioribacteraceae bacterium]
MKDYFRSLFFILFIINGAILSQTILDSNTNINNGLQLSLRFHQPIFSVIEKGSRKIASYSEFIDASYPGYPALPSKNIYVAIPPNSKINVELTERKLESILDIEPAANPQLMKTSDSTYQEIETELSASAFSSDEYPNTDIELIGYSWVRDYYCAIIKVNTHSYNWKERKISFLTEATLKINYTSLGKISSVKRSKSDFDEELSQLIINYDSADEFRSIPNYDIHDDGDWIDKSNEYIKYAISQDGLYRITKEDLDNLGVSTLGINPKSFKIYFKGKQREVYVSGENDNTFDPGDYIEFWGEKNYGSLNYRTIVKSRDEYLNYMDRYSDTAFVWLTWHSDEGNRVFVDNSFNGIVTDTINTHLAKIHLEQDVRLWYYDSVSPRTNLPFYQENKVWTWFFMGASGNTPRTFTASDIVPNQNVNTIVRLISNASNIQQNAHKTGVSLNSSTVQESITYDYLSTVNLSASFNTNTMVNGTNTFRVFGMPTTAAFHQFLVDWIDIDYPRFNVAKNDSITVRIREDIVSGNKIIKITNINSPFEDISVYKLKPSFKKITGFKLIGTSIKTLIFTDNVSPGDEYYIVKKSLIKKPKLAYKKYFANLRDRSRGADYIIITHPSLASSSNAYKDFISKEYGIRAQLFFVNDIYDEFNYGLKSAEAIRDFLMTAYSNWQAPAPSYLTIIGDANYDFRDVVTPAPAIRKKDLVPSFGMPVSDSWYVMWDSLNPNIPQMYVGRIPAENNQQVNHYLNKHKSYISRGFDEWNKQFLFFSGGDPTKPSELEQIKSTNQFVLDKYVKNEPVGGNGFHFYKTINPVSNFGPVRLKEFNDIVSDGGLFISYLGHSGTQTWDNGITTVLDLKNYYNDRLPLITDFGCSTGRFAEPDVNAFGESFTSGSTDGQAIAYFGNSSYGYLSTSLLFPKLFYEKLLIDNITIIGKAHSAAKMKMLTDYGSSEVNRVFNYCNLLFGDPIINFALPSKPNYKITNSNISLPNSNPSDLDQFTKIKFDIKNLGRVPADSLDIIITDTYNGTIIYELKTKIASPLFNCELIKDIPVSGKIGVHTIKIELDNANKIEELSEEDNSAQIEFNVHSTNLRALENDDYYNSNRESILLLNPIDKMDNNDEKLLLSIVDNESFNNPQESTHSFDSLFTEIKLNNLQNDKRYWWRSRLSSRNDWSSLNSFVSNNNYTWFMGSDFREKDINPMGLIFNQTTKEWELAKGNVVLRITSAGGNDGKFASVLRSGEEKLPNTFFWGIVTAEVDQYTLTVNNIKYYNYPQTMTETSTALINYINSLPEGKTVIVAICDDGAQSVLNYSPPSAVRNAIKALGSKFIDDVRYRESWAMIGKKGAPVGTVPESYKKHFEGPAIVEISKLVKQQNGYAIFPLIGQSTGWETINLDYTLPSNSTITITPLGIKDDGTVDTLTNINLTEKSIDISSIDYKTYPKIKLKTGFAASPLFESPTIKSIGVNYKTLPELGLNYQVVNLSSDSVKQGNNIQLFYSVVNAGKTKAENVSLQLELIKPDNSKKVLKDTTISSIDPYSKKHFSYTYNSNNSDGYGEMSFNITVDKENKIRELFKDNNSFKRSFYVKKDEATSVASAKIRVLFDGNEILNDDYISYAPLITAELDYQGNFPVHDTSAVQFYLDNNRIYYSSFDNISYDTIQRKVIFKYQPVIEEGEHILSVSGRDLSGNINDGGYQIRFIVQKEMKLLNTYNFPNPFKDYTYFTFQLTQLPEEMFINIFTVAGRLIKEIKLNSSELKTSLNSIFWDGRDADGNLIANGTYFYKLGIKKDSKIETVIQKFSIVR